MGNLVELPDPHAAAACFSDHSQRRIRPAVGLARLYPSLFDEGVTILLGRLAHGSGKVDAVQEVITVTA